MYHAPIISKARYEGTNALLAPFASKTVTTSPDALAKGTLITINIVYYILGYLDLYLEVVTDHGKPRY